MSNYTSKKLAFNNAEQFKESFFEPEPATLGYIFLGNHVAWPNEDAPTTAVDTVSNEKSIWDNMFAGKKITGNDVELVIPRVDWVANKKYREYDDTIDLTELITSNTAQNLGPVYVMNSDRNVYLCLSNNTTTANSTVEPTGKNFNANGIIQTADSYVWKYLYNIRPSNKFFSNNWIPAPISTAKLDYDTSSLISIDGELTTIVVVSSGSGYIHSTITVSAFASGCTILSVANTTNLTANMAVSGTGIASGTHIESVDTVNTKIQLSSSTTNSGGGTGNNVSVQTRVYISGDGIGGVASVVLTGNSINDISVSSYGKDYSVANVYIYGTGTGAQVRAVLPPKFGHGYNPAKQLGASNVMVAMRIGEVDSTEGGIISTDTTFRQYGLLRDPYKYGNTSPVISSNANTVISQTTNLTLIAGTDFELNEFVYQGVSANNAFFYGFVNAQTPNEVRLTKVRGTVSVGGLLIGANSGITRTVVRKFDPEFQPYTGDILYVENTQKIQRADGQAENVKFVIRF